MTIRWPQQLPENIDLAGNSTVQTAPVDRTEMSDGTIMTRSRGRGALERRNAQVHLTDEQYQIFEAWMEYYAERGGADIEFPWTADFPMVPGVPAVPPAQGAPHNRHVLDISGLGTNADNRLTEQISTDLNPNQFATTPRRWNTDSGASTSSGGTGPGTNNTRDFVYYETSSQGEQDSAAWSVFTIDGGTGNTQAVTDWLASDNRRSITLVAFATGTRFNSTENGLWLWSSETDPNFPGTGNATRPARESAVRALGRERMPGWAYSGTGYGQGTSITDFAGNSFVSAFAGGWRNYTFTVPVGHRYVGFFVEAERPVVGSSAFHADAGFSRIILVEQDPDIPGKAGIPAIPAGVRTEYVTARFYVPGNSPAYDAENIKENLWRISFTLEREVAQ